LLIAYNAVLVVLTTWNIPCGCRLTQSEHEVRVLVCTLHQLKYAIWRGTDDEFVKRIVTPSLHERDMAEFNVEIKPF